MGRKDDNVSSSGDSQTYVKRQECFTLQYDAAEKRYDSTQHAGVDDGGVTLAQSGQRRGRGKSGWKAFFGIVMIYSRSAVQQPKNESTGMSPSLSL